MSGQKDNPVKRGRKEKRIKGEEDNRIIGIAK